MRPITAIATVAAPTAMVNLDPWQSAAMGVQVVPSGGAQFTVDYSFDDPNDLVNPVPVGSMFFDTSMVPGGAVGGSAGLTFAIPTSPIWARLRLLNGVGQVRATFLQPYLDSKTISAAAAAPPPLGLDGFTAIATGASSAFALPPLTTTRANDIIIVNVTLAGQLVSSVTDTAGLTWSPRYNTNGVAVFYAVAPAILTADVITVNFNFGSGNIGWAFAISGVHTAAPWDTNVSLPAYTATGGANMTGTYSTSNANDLVLCLSYLNATGSFPPPGFTQIGSNNTGTIAGFYETVTSLQSSTTVTITGPFPSYLYLDALRAGP